MNMSRQLHYDEEDKRFIKETMLQGIDRWLPQIAEEVTPIILQKTKELVTKNIMMKINSNIRKQNALSEGLLIMQRNPKLWRELLDRRLGYYYKLTRVASVLSLYKEGLLELPIYVPYKFRQDEARVKSHDALDQMHKMNVQRLQSEITILEIKLDDIRKEINNIDAEIAHEISHLSRDETVVNVIKRDIAEKVMKDTNRIDEQCEVKSQIRRQAYKEDQRMYEQRKQQVRSIDMRRSTAVRNKHLATRSQETIEGFSEEENVYQERGQRLRCHDGSSPAREFLEHSDISFRRACATRTKEPPHRCYAGRNPHSRFPDVVYPVSDITLQMEENNTLSNNTRTINTRVEREEEVHMYDDRKQCLRFPRDISTEQLSEENMMFIPNGVITNAVHNEIIESQNRNVRSPGRPGSTPPCGPGSSLEGEQYAMFSTSRKIEGGPYSSNYDMK